MIGMVQNKRRPTLNRRRGNARHVLLLLTFPLLLTAIAAALYWGWQVVWQAAPWSPQFSLHPANIEILTESPWVDEASILQQVVHEASLDDQLTILDPGLNERLSLAIEDHPWVEHVERVEKFQPPRVVVTLRYRHPVAFIKNNQPVLSGKKQLPSVGIVDRHGIRLPLDNSLVRSPAVQALAEFRGIPFRPPPPGDAWKEGRVRGGARIAEALRHDWDLFGLRAIETSMQPVVGSSESYAFTLITKGGRQIPWGPEYVDAEVTEAGKMEPTATEKVSRLKAYVTENGIDLDGHPRHPAAGRPADAGKR